MKPSTVCRLLAIQVILAVGILSPIQAQNPEAQFQQGLMKEEGEGSLLEAIDIYNEVAGDESAGRSLQAEALLHMGLCYEKLGRTEAQKTYRNLIQNYPDQTETVKIAEEKLSLLSQTEINETEKSGELSIRKVWEVPDYLFGEVSPDGKYISYGVWSTGDLAIYELANGKTRRLTNNDSSNRSQVYAEYSRWSADGKQLVYTWRNGTEYELRTIGLDGSEPKVLYTNEEARYIAACDWSPDGKQILACMDFKDNKIETAGLINVSDGSMQVLKTLEGRPKMMCFSKNGKSIIYDRQQESNTSMRDIYMLPLDGGAEIALVKHPANDLFQGLAPDGESIVFSSDRDGSTGLYLTRIENGLPSGDPHLLKSDIGQIEVLGFKPSGAFYYTTQKELSDVYMAKLDASGYSHTPLEKMETRFQGNNRLPAYSPDGTHLAYISVMQPSIVNFNRGGGNMLVIRSLETKQEQRIIPELHQIGYPHWSPDSKQIMVVEFTENNTMGLHQIDIQSGQVKTILSPDEGLLLFGKCEYSPDGATFYYGKMDMKNRVRKVMSRDLESGAEKTLYESKYFLQITLSPDGLWLAVNSRDPSTPGDKMLLLPTSGGEVKDLITSKEGENLYIGFHGFCTWTIDGKYILFGSILGPAGSIICRVPASGGEIEKIGVAVPGERASSLSMAPDGRRIAFSFYTLPLSPAVWVMENFLPSD